MSFWEEVKQRNLIKVAAAYAIVAWLLVQVVSVIEAPLGLPGWTDTLVIVILAVGFVVSLFLAWAYELTPDGIKRTKDVPLGESVRRVTGRRLNYSVTGLLALAVAFLVVDNYVLDDRNGSETLEANSEPATGTTLFVLPLQNISPDPDDEPFADGLTDELIRQLQRLPGLRVMGSATSFAYRGRSVPEVSGVRRALRPGGQRRVGRGSPARSLAAQRPVGFPGLAV